METAGLKRTSEFWLNRRLVGVARWYGDGTPSIAWGVRKGVLHGYRIFYEERSVFREGRWAEGPMFVTYAEPFVDGLLHGWAKQYTLSGPLKLIIECPFKRGTGTDYWCEDGGNLAEEHPSVAGKPSGYERWWDEPKGTVYAEHQWFAGRYHGIGREWKNGTLKQGFPKFFIRHKEVSKREYIKRCRRDATLQQYRREDDAPQRTLPARFVELRQRARRKRRR